MRLDKTEWELALRTEAGQVLVKWLETERETVNKTLRISDGVILHRAQGRAQLLDEIYRLMGRET